MDTKKQNKISFTIAAGIYCFGVLIGLTAFKLALSFKLFNQLTWTAVFYSVLLSLTIVGAYKLNNLIFGLPPKADPDP